MAVETVPHYHRFLVSLENLVSIKVTESNKARSLIMKLPDGPKTPPWLQLIQWIADALGYMETSFQDYGDVFTVRMGYLFQGVFISNPQLIQTIFTAEPKLFDSGRGNKSGKIFVGENSLLLLDGDRFPLNNSFSEFWQ